MDKCIFIGYPDGYKGWMFYNLTTKRSVISECAEFDERYFPGLKHTPLMPQPFELPPDVPFHPLLDLGELLPIAPKTPPANPILLEPATPVSNYSSSPEPSPTIPLAI